MTSFREQPYPLCIADCLQSYVQTYPQTSEDSSGGYFSEQDQIMDAAAIELRNLHNEVQKLSAQVEEGKRLLREEMQRANRYAEKAETKQTQNTLWEKFPAYLIDHYEGETITEEGLQRALSAMLADPQYSK